MCHLCCAAAADADFLGFSTTSQSPAEESFLPESPPAEPSGFSMDAQTAAQPTSSPAPPSADGLADFFSTSAQEPASSSYSAEDRSSTAHIDDMFSAAPKPAAVQQRPSQASSGAATAQRRGQGGASSSSAGVGAGFSGGSGPALAAPKPAAPRPAVPTSMIDFGDEAAMLAQNPDLYQGLQAVEGALSDMF